MIWPFKPKMGLDIGGRTLKGIQLKKSGGKVHLDKFFFYDLAEGNAGFPTVTGLGDSLKALVEVTGFKDHLVASCLNENEVAIFDFTLPKMPAADLPQAVAAEIEQQINFPIEEASIGHIVVSSTNSDGQERLNIKAFCVRLEDINKTTHFLEQAQLNPESLEISMLANISMLAFNNYLDDGAYSIVMDLGETRTSVALIYGGKLISTSSIDISSGTINRRLRDVTGSTYLEAEKIKKRVTLKIEESDASTQEIVENVYVELFQELQRCVEFFQLTANEQPITKIFAIGGGAQYPSVTAAIKSACGIETVIVNPFRNIEIFSAGKSGNEKIGLLASHMGTVVGLALRKLDAS